MQGLQGRVSLTVESKSGKSMFKVVQHNANDSDWSKCNKVNRFGQIVQNNNPGFQDQEENNQLK